jgi:transcriptional regulator with XRE-family HTH domain
VSVLLASLLKQHRQRAGINQSELSRRIACDHAYINRVEKDKQRMSRQFVVDAARALGLDAYDSAQLVAAAGYWPWPDVLFRDVLSLLECGASVNASQSVESVA